MVRAWVMDDAAEDQRLEHQTNPPQFVNLNELKKTTGVLYWKLNPETLLTDGILQKIREERGYSYEDVIEISPDKLPNYEEKLAIFFKEHLHLDEEIRYVMEGSGYFDVRDATETWIRIEVVKGDLIVLPAGIYHRFTLDSKNYIKAMRLFIGEPVWTPHNRPAEVAEEARTCRESYLKLLEGNQNQA